MLQPARDTANSSLARYAGLLQLCFLLGCTDDATIGGLCSSDCDASASCDCRPRACASADCAAGRAAGDTAGATQDACAADGCRPDAGAACSSDAYRLQRQRLDLVIAFDDAASLYLWWPALREGLDQFLQEDASRGLGVGLVRFADDCDPQHYIDPLVPIAPLPDNLAALQQALPLDATTNTSTIPALSGSLQYARSWAIAHPDARVAVVLLTDGSPGSCDALTGDYDAEASRVARAAREGSPSIATYVVGVSALPTISTLATAGGTDLLAIATAPADGEVQAALDKLRREAQSCAFAGPSGADLASAAQVVVTAANGDERRYDIQRGSGACALGGFRVDDAAAPYSLIACPDTCAGLAATDQLSLPHACSSP